jgi:hypothetical protein
MAADVEDSACKGKEKVAELPKVTEKWGGSRKSHGTGKSLLTPAILKINVMRS